MINTEDNILIAQYIGMQETSIGWFDNDSVLTLPANNNTFDTLLFDKEWNWFIPTFKVVYDEFEDEEVRDSLLGAIRDGNLSEAYVLLVKAVRDLVQYNEKTIRSYKLAIYNFMGIIPINVGGDAKPYWTVSISPWLVISEKTEKECLDKLLDTDILQTNWLIIMDVVEKVEALGFYVNSMGWACSIHKSATTYADVPKSAVSSKKQSIFLALGELLFSLGPSLSKL